jgi:small subunit ribosomal protein S13
MVYLFEQHISPKKTIEYALTVIHGLNASKAKDITNALCINGKKRFGTLGLTQIRKISKYILTHYRVGGILKKHVNDNIKRKIKIRSYQGIRHRLGLPVRGQRTHTNAQTQKRIRKQVF